MGFLWLVGNRGRLNGSGAVLRMTIHCAVANQTVSVVLVGRFSGLRL